MTNVGGLGAGTTPVAQAVAIQLVEVTMNGLQRYRIGVVMLAVLLGSILAAAAARQAAAAPPPVSTLVAIRAAYHSEATPRYDRVVFEFRGPVPLIDVRYVNQLIADGSGLPVSITGNAILQLRMTPAQAHTERGQPTAPGRITLRLPTVRQVARAGDFEGVVTYGIGVARKAEIRVTTLAGPSRIVIDVLHR